MTEPLRISVEIAKRIEYCWYGEDAWNRNAPIIDSRIRPLVEALQRIKTAWEGAVYDEDFVYRLSSLEPRMDFPDWLDAALNDAGAE